MQIKGPSPEEVEYIGMKNLINAVKKSVGLRNGELLFGFEGTLVHLWKPFSPSMPPNEIRRIFVCVCIFVFARKYDLLEKMMENTSLKDIWRRNMKRCIVEFEDVIWCGYWITLLLVNAIRLPQNSVEDIQVNKFFCEIWSGVLNVHCIVFS